MSRMIDLSGKIFGRLTVVSLLTQRDSKGNLRWLCKCICGNTKSMKASNLLYGHTKSCGCLKTEKKPLVKCKIEGCLNNTKKGSQGLCGKHYVRLKRYNDVNYITPSVERITSQRESFISNHKAKTGTYKKYYGRHEHRVIAELKLGRKLLPNEIVHHLDNNKHNNSPDNLVVMTQSEHASIHFKEMWRIRHAS